MSISSTKKGFNKSDLFLLCLHDKKSSQWYTKTLKQKFSRAKRLLPPLMPPFMQAQAISTPTLEELAQLVKTMIPIYMEDVQAGKSLYVDFTYPHYSRTRQWVSTLFDRN
jgi:hypothetical protein